MDDQDLRMYKSFKNVLRQGDFDIKGEAILTVASLFQWFDSLEGKIKTQINLNSGPAIKLKNLKPVKGSKDASK